MIERIIDGMAYPDIPAVIEVKERPGKGALIQLAVQPRQTAEWSPSVRLTEPHLRRLRDALNAILDKE